MSSVVKVRNLNIGAGMPKICVPMVGRDETEILSQLRAILSSPADLIEWRIDFYSDVRRSDQVASMLHRMRMEMEDMPLLVTFRSKEEGGQETLAAAEYESLLLAVARTGEADLLDVECFHKGLDAKALIEKLHELGVLVVGSNHDFEKTPDEAEIVRRLTDMRECGADIAKIAVMPQSKRDVEVLLSATQSIDKSVGPIITMSMGELGQTSRILGETYGSAVTFGAVGDASAPGQIGAEELKALLIQNHHRLYEDGEKQMTNIFLIGFMGTGKSTIAAALKEELSLPCAEMDDLIVKDQGMPITEIFAKYGEEYFRDVESDVLFRFTKEHPGIISCGGGTVLREQNEHFMHENGCIVLLTAEPKTIYERVKDAKDRPMLNGHMDVDYIASLMEKRRTRYEAAADVVIATDGKSIDEICEEIIAETNH